MDNRSSNYSLGPLIGNNEHISIEYSLYIPITIGISSLIGTIFSILDLIRYYRENDLHSHFNYIYHNMLIFCLSHSIFYISAFYFGVYLSWFVIYPIFCRIFLIHRYAIFAGLAYLLMWTSLERHRFLFRINPPLSLSRQIFPLILVLIFVYTCSIFFVLLSKCSKEKFCEVYLCQSFVVVIFFAFYTFIIPIVTMICSTGILVWRLFQHRTRLTKYRRWIRLKRIFYQSIIYFLWYSSAYWPSTIYSLLSSYDSKRFDSIILETTSHLISIYAIQILPLLTYFIFRSNKKRTQNNLTLSNKTQINVNEQQIWIIKWLKYKKQPPVVERF